MYNKVFLLSSILILASCTTYYEEKNCDPEKNYVKSNPEAIEEYKKLLNEGKVEGYYVKILPSKDCSNNQCFSYDLKKYKFQEMYFNDSTRKGIYTITISSKDKNKDCIQNIYGFDKKCYEINKNENEQIKSRYYLENIIQGNTNYRKFIDVNTNTILFEVSFQVYHLPSVSGEPTGSTCTIVKDNNPHYKFNPLQYP